MQVANQNAPGQPSLSSYDFSQRPNVGVQLAQGLGAVGQAIQQNEAAQRISDFQKAFGQAYAAGDRDALRQLAATNPDQIETIRQGMGFVDADRNQAMGDMSARLNIAAAQGPEAVMRELVTHQNTLQQIGVSPEQAWQTYQQSPEGFTQLTDLIGMHAVGPEKYFDIQDKMVGRQLEQGRLNESVRQADMENSRGWANIQNAQLDRAQRAQMHNDNVALKLQELGMKQQESGKIDPKLVRDLNSDINGFSKNYSAMRSASDNLQALGKRNTPAAQLGMIFNYMKSLDPQSVVREGEQVQVKRTDGIFGTLGNYVSQLSNGKMLNNEQVQDLINTSKLMANTEGEKFNQQMDDYLSTYGDSLPSGLTKQLQSRKAKLYEDIQQPAQQQTQQATSGGQTFREGMTAKNPKTGQKIIYRNGQWQPM
ncbi:phage DNA ejection protein [Salmonella enterica subsp. enterica]|nr:phage DNA ejection protein [Salmonella enterica subsp. enterica]